MNIGQELARFSQSLLPGSIGNVARDRACDAICDGLGAGIAGAKTATFERLLASLPAFTHIDAAPRSRLIGHSLVTSPEYAALANGTAVHALDFDDIAHPAYTHPTAVALPAFLAMCSIGQLSGERALAAYVLALETANRLGRCINLGHYRRGWHATSTIGTVAATVGAAYLVSLDPDRTARAISIAASMAGGLRANFGTMTKPLHAGLGARATVEAVLLARGGLTASEEAISGQHGFLDVFAEAGSDVEGIMAGFGQSWEIESPVGLALKPYPSCGATHSAIEAALIIRERRKRRPVRVYVGVSEWVPSVLVYRRPKTALEAKFSMEYCVGLSLLRGPPRLGDFESDARVREFVDLDLLSRIEVEVDDRIRFESEPAAILEVEFEDGSTDSETVMISKGKGARWPTLEDQREKFSDCLRYGGRSDEEGVWKAARSLLSGGSLNSLEAAVGVLSDE